MVLFAFAIVSYHWKPASFSHGQYSDYPLMSLHLPREVFDERMASLSTLVRASYPHLYFESYMFSVTVLLTIIAAGVCIVIRATGYSLWYPFLVLVVPAVMAYGVAHRRSAYKLRMSKFLDLLQTHLKKISAHDAHASIQWGERQPGHEDTLEVLHLPVSTDYRKISLVITMMPLTSEAYFRMPGQDILPAYAATSGDVVLNVGPPAFIAEENVSWCYF
ncbi:hypothetical protein BDF14DRAFT_1834557 [Spinellus fusiger]|nr:hypothetical protein BDF14DRAFT_1834557 [Spinellus fusiger]